MSSRRLRKTSWKTKNCYAEDALKTSSRHLEDQQIFAGKLPKFVIGKSAKPRCFKNAKILPCCYRLQVKSWMNSFLLDGWVKELDKKFEKENRKVILIADNCPTHSIIEGLKVVVLVSLPPNTTSKTQSMDQGVIRSLKAKYHQKKLLKG